MPTAAPPELLTSYEVCEQTGLTYRQLDYWLRCGVPLPIVQEAAGSGSRRLFHPSSVHALSVVARVAASPVISHMNTRLITEIVCAVLAGENCIEIGEGITICWTNS